MPNITYDHIIHDVHKIEIVARLEVTQIRTLSKTKRVSMGQGTNLRNSKEEFWSTRCVTSPTNIQG